MSSVFSLRKLYTASDSVLFLFFCVLTCQYIAVTAVLQALCLFSDGDKSRICSAVEKVAFHNQADTMTLVLLLLRHKMQVSLPAASLHMGSLIRKNDFLFATHT